MWLKFLKINKRTFSLGLLVILLCTLFISNSRAIKAAQYTTPEGCSVELYFLKPDGNKDNANSINIPKDQSSGYQAQVVVKGDKCGPPYRGFYRSSGFIDNKWETLYDLPCKELNTEVQTHSLDFNLQKNYQKYEFDFNVWKGSECDTNGGTLVKSLAISAKLVDAQNNNSNGNANNSNANKPPDPNAGKVVCKDPNDPKKEIPCTTPTGDFDKPIGELKNPIQYDSIIALLMNWIKLFSLVILFFSIGMIMYGGLRMITSSGSESALKAGKTAVIWAILAVVLSLLSFSIVSIIQRLFGAV